MEGRQEQFFPIWDYIPDLRLGKLVDGNVNF